MNATNVKNALTTAINTLVANGDLRASPINATALVGELAGRVAAYESEAVQRSADVASANKIAQPNRKLT